ncbi:DNA gyrase inhibitor YacG [Ruegeria aquimaris]|uniref:DNA gyrase inhibitor YacG n=1 Tax=Ruegeria aquimaris TaxID=2984333 RepID=A0ABT3ARI4_9RHOB|nr:DNA gyrase inhibitor YacG [Ruegeria sp. XHP0148]MCV2891290.1 DNA gyrase inhibitor YacG [Ruegeria sp. XHP0148]
MSCPICGAEQQTKYRPFCSKRCSDLDLAKWLNGSYAIPAEAAAEEEEWNEADRSSTEPRH